MGAAAVLQITRNGQAIKSQSVDGEVVAGRGEGCVIRLDDRAISRQHAVFKPVPGGVQVERKSEFAPVSVNGTEVTRAVLKEGDVVSIGPYLIRYEEKKEAQKKERTQTQAPPVQVHAPEPVQELASQQSSGFNLDATPEIGEPEIPGINGFDISQDAASGSASSVEDPGQPISLEGYSNNSNDLPSFSPTADENGVTRVTIASSISAVLQFKPGAANVTEFEIQADAVSIGRGKECDIILNDKKSSRKNSVISRRGGRYYIKDQGSANGTYVNDTRVEEAALSSEDVVRIGDVVFTFRATDSEYAAQARNFMPVPAQEPEPDQYSGPVLEPPPEFNYQPAPLPASPEAVSLVGPASAAPMPDSGIAGIAGIAGLSGPGANPKGSLIEKFRALPPKRQAIWGFIGLAVMYYLFFDEPVQQPSPKAKTAAVAKGAMGPSGQAAKPGVAFEALPPEQKQNVERWHDLAFDHYKNRDYDKALFELNRIFALVPDFKDSREIERYAKEGKRQLEAREAEKRKREEEEKVKARLAQLVQEIGEKMGKKQYVQARELFSEVLTLDPDNEQITKYRQEMDKVEEDRRIAEQEKIVRDEIRARAKEALSEARALQNQGKFRNAIVAYGRVKEINPNDRRLASAVDEGISQSTQAIAELRDPVIAEGKEAESSGELPKAYKLFEKARGIDPTHPEPSAGMNRIRDVLHERAKGLYTEAVLAESYSDFAVAKQKFRECMETAPQDDVYYERSQRKLSKYFGRDELIAPNQ